MFGNGVLIGGTFTPAARVQILLDLQQAFIALGAAAVGTPNPTDAGLPIAATSTSRATATLA